MFEEEPTPLTETTAVRLPVAVGSVVKPTVSVEDVAVVTVPTAPSLKVTVSFAAVVEKLVPAMERVVALINRLAVLNVTVGAATTVAT